MVKYSNEFKEEAVNLLLNGVPVSLLDRLESISNSLHRQKARYLPPPPRADLRDDNDELHKLHQQVKDLLQENKFLKSNAFFAKNLTCSDITTSKQTAANIRLRRWFAGPRLSRSDFYAWLRLKTRMRDKTNAGLLQQI
jgi:hypothetical protein